MVAPIETTVSVLRASSVAGIEPPALRIEAVRPIPSGHLSLDGARAVHREQGIALADALLASLPGGTVDVLIGELLRRRASLFAIPLEGA